MSTPIRFSFKLYAGVGVFLVLLALVMLSINYRAFFTLQQADWFIWQTVTGATLGLALLYQFALMIARIGKDAKGSQTHFKWHRYVGIAMLFVFILHAVRFGHALTLVLSVVFLLNSLMGVLNREVVRYPNKRLFYVWYAAHVGLSAILLPLAVLHAWVALAYE